MFVDCLAKSEPPNHRAARNCFYRSSASGEIGETLGWNQTTRTWRPVSMRRRNMYTCQQSSGSDSLRRMCFWHGSGPDVRPLQITDRNRWDSIPSVSIRILLAGTTSYKKGCWCFLCSYQQWWCQCINLNHQIMRFIFLELILLNSILLNFIN